MRTIDFAAKKSVEDLGNDVTADEKEAIEKATKELNEALSGNDLESIKAKKKLWKRLLKVLQLKHIKKLKNNKLVKTTKVLKKTKTELLMLLTKKRSKIKN